MKNKTQRGEVYLSEGDSLAKNHLFQKALLRLKKAHQMGCESAACKIGKIYMSSDFKDYEQAFSWLRLGAESGDREAQYYLSKFYEFDLLDKYDLNEAHKWLQKSADQDEVRAIMRLSYWYRFGRYGIPDMEKGWKLLQRAAGLGSADALFQLAVIYEHGNEMVESDLPEAMKYYQLAASKHHASALFRLGICYWKGIYFPKNLLLSIQYLEESCALGCCEAQYYLATICATDFYHHTFKRYVLLQAAAKQNHDQAMYELGCMYLFGNSFLSIDRSLAHYWFRKAADLGNEKALEMCLKNEIS